jgi:hypothetical protein
MKSADCRFLDPNRTLFSTLLPNHICLERTKNSSSVRSLTGLNRVGRTERKFAYALQS